VTVTPATTTDPVRELLVGDAEIVTAPLPLPDAPLVIVSHPLFDCAVQVQPEAAATFTVAVPPLTGIRM